MKFQNKRFLTTFIVLVNVFLEDSNGSDPGDVEKYLQAGTKLLAAGQFMDALSQYDKAIEGDIKNYLIYYRRATVFLGLGKTKSAIDDLSISLNLNHGFSPARSQRANLFTKQGRLQEAKEDMIIILKQKPGDADVLKQLKVIDEIANEIELSKSHYENGNYEDAIKYLDRVIEIATLSQSFREMRANCFLKIGNTEKAILDFRHSVKLSNDDREGILHLSRLLYEVGNAEQSLIEIRNCLKLDPDHKDCFKHYKKVKKLEKLLNSIQYALKENRLTDCMTLSKQLIDNEPLYQNTANQYICSCGVKGGNPKIVIKICESAVEVEPSNLDLVCDLAEGYIGIEEYNSAIKYYQQVLESDKHFRRAREGLQKAQKLLKNLKKRNYYKILNLPRTATKKEILKAYRKLAAEYHPDRFKGENKITAERKFIDISDAKEVLSNAENRKRYDNGEDPLDPEQQHQGPSGNPFGFTFHNFNPFEHNDGYQYEFNFG